MTHNLTNYFIYVKNPTSGEWVPWSTFSATTFREALTKAKSIVE